jgi:DNA replication and repair protein RecF
LTNPHLTRLILQDFRSYPVLDLDIAGRMVAFSGENGAGKTNLLEAISLLTAGRGLRRVELGDMAREKGSGGFAVAAELSGPLGAVRLGTGLEPPGPDGHGPRKYRIDGEAVSSAIAFNDHLRMVWLTPAFDGLFAGSAGDRRRFLDRLVLAIDPSHAARVSGLERALRSRNKILEEHHPDPVWLDAVEREVAETGVAVAAARRETVGQLAGLIAQERTETSVFPWAEIQLEGLIETELAQRAAVDVEDSFRTLLRQNRGRDKAAGRATIGPQASDLVVWHGPKNVAAERASTGEQKALLIGIVLAHVRLVALTSGMAPLVLLDEVAAHLDPRRRKALFETLDQLGAQVFMTGADTALFQDLPVGSERFHVTPGRVERIV